MFDSFFKILFFSFAHFIQTVHGWNILLKMIVILKLQIGFGALNGVFTLKSNIIWNNIYFFC